MLKIAKGPRRAWKRTTQAWRKALVERSPDWVRRTFGPSATYLDMLIFDHGLFRLAYFNRHRIDDKTWRSAQPAPHHIRRLARDGIRTIVNLRGSAPTSTYWLEQEACARAGIKMIDFQVRSRAAPTKAEVLAARELFERVEYPMLMHCKSGADRAGLMSVLYAHVRQGQPIAEAMSHLSLRYGHIRQADTGILDHFFEAYLEQNARRPIEFFEWVETMYDPEAIKQTFHASSLANRIVDTVLRRE
jgi:protein tyrosine/serine phosphatase